MKKTLYLNVSQEEISPYVIFSGDPWRVEVLKEFLKDAKRIAFNREYNTYTGTYRGVRVSVSSTGIGSPSAVIALEEMYEVGLELAIRMGTVMSLDDDMLGHYIIPVGSIRGESTSKTYVEEAYPAVSDFELLKIASDTVRIKYQSKVLNGISMTLDGFYTQMKESKLSKERKIDINQTFKYAKSLGVCGMDMESSAMMVAARLMNVKFVPITLVTVLYNLSKQLDRVEREEKEKELCLIALDTVYQYHKTKENQK